MLASLLHSKQAIQINIQIMRIFTKVRQMLADQTAVKLEIAEIKEAIHKIAKKQEGHDKNIDLLFQYIDRLQEEAEAPHCKARQLKCFHNGIILIVICFQN
ncbi:hypothetical protein D9M68_807190 [compost metagenome]